MLIITNGNQTEAILESNYEKYEEQNGAVMQISFSSFSFAENVGHVLLDYEVIVEDEDGHEYKVKQYQQNGPEKRITATHIFYELSGHYLYDIYGGTRTFHEFASWLFSSTGWTFQNIDVTGSQIIVNFGENNVLQLIKILCSVFNCEYRILPGKVIQFAQVIGEDNDLQYRYKYNINDLTQSIDTTSLKTQIRGYGANGLVVTYTSPLANHPRIGVRIAEPFYDDAITTQSDQSEMTKALKAQLPDAPETVVEVSVVEVDGDVGDHVWIIHEELDLLYQTRILAKKTKRNYADSIVTVGNTVRKDMTDILVSQKAAIDENKRITRSKFEQTNERITMEVETIGESIATLEIRSDQIATSVVDTRNELSSRITQTATQIRTEVTDVKNNLQSSITQTASQIRLEVSSQVTTINNNISTTNQNVASLQMQANQISSTVSSQSTQISNLGTRVSSAESSIIQQAGQISSKVSETDYNGNTIASLINQTATTIKLQADRIEFDGEIFGDGATFEGDINTTQNIYVGRNITMQGSSGGRINLPYTDCSIGAGSSGNLNIEAFNDITLVGSEIHLYGDVVFHGDVDGVAVAHTSGLGIAYSSAANRLYVRINGSDVGYVELT